MLEDRCHLLDIQLAANMAKANDAIDQAGFDSYVATQSQIRNFEYLVADYHQKINLSCLNLKRKKKSVSFMHQD